MAAFREADCVAFDVDSTVITSEGVVELARWMKVRGIDVITQQAMGGKLGFAESFQKRMDLLTPSRDQLQRFSHGRPPVFSPHVEELISKLHARGTRVFLVSGGLRDLILPIANDLSIPADRVFANRLHFTAAGEYDGVDFTQPTSRSGGKAKVLESLDCAAPVMIGDGVTDLEAMSAAAAVIGYGGNVVRPRVAEQSDWFIRSFSQLLKHV
jgi:phosphoserine phosphatase